MDESERGKIRGKPRPTKPPIKPLQPGQCINGDMWLKDERLLGRLVMEWSRLEAAIQALVWAFLRLSNDEGKLVTSKMDVGVLLQMLRALATQKLKIDLLAGFLTHINATEDIKETRNLMVHGLWHRIAPDNDAAAMSIRVKIEDGKGFSVSETFPEGRIIRMVIAIKAIRQTFNVLEAGLLTSPEILLTQHHSD